MKKVAIVDTFIASIYIGNCYGYSLESFGYWEVVDAVSVFQKSQLDFCSATMSSTCFIAGDYKENGFCIGLINYPRFPKSKEQIKVFAEGLVEHLMTVFKQNRISVVYPHETVMYESENAQENP